MFDLVFSVFEAWNAIGFLIMASVFLLIGGGLVGHFLYWQMKSKAIEGRVVGLRVTHSKNNSTSSSDGVVSSDDGTDGNKGVPIIVTLFFILFPLIFAGIGVWNAYTYYDLTTNGVLADAQVSRNDSSTDSDGNTTYKAVLSFTDQRGNAHEVKDTISYGSSPSYDVGTKIGVYYDVEDPTRFVIADFWHNMAIAIAFIAFSSVFVLFFVFILFFANKPSKATEEKAPSTDGYGQEVFYPVYEYKTAQGERAEFVDSVGGNTFLHALPGSRVRLLMIPGNPPKVKKRRYIGLIFGLIFLAPGLFIGQMAVSQFKLSFGMIALVLAALGFVSMKVIKFLDKIPAADKKKGWDAVKSGEIFNSENMTITSTNNGEKGRLLEPDEIRARIPGQRKLSNISGVILLLIVGGLFVGSYYAGQSMLHLVQNGVRSQGEVASLRQKRSDDSYVYHAVVEFKDAQGKEHKFEDSVGSSSPMFQRGDEVTVLYMPNKPNDAIIDRGIYNWTLSGLLGAGALLLLWAALASLQLAARAGRSGAYRTAL